MDRCARTTIEDTLACNSQRPMNHVCSQEEQKKQKKAWQACWRAVEREEKVEAHLFIGNPSMSWGSTDEQPKHQYHQCYYTLHQWPMYPARKPYAQWTRSDQLLVHCLRRAIQPTSLIHLEKKEWCRRHLSLHMKVNAITCFYSPYT